MGHYKLQGPISSTIFLKGRGWVVDGGKSLETTFEVSRLP